MEVSGHPMGY